MLHLAKELLLLEVIAMVSTFSDVNGFIDSSSEVNQSVTSLTTCQCLIATGHSAITAIVVHRLDNIVYSMEHYWR